MYYYYTMYFKWPSEFVGPGSNIPPYCAYPIIVKTKVAIKLLEYMLLYTAIVHNLPQFCILVTGAALILL